MSASAQVAIREYRGYWISVEDHVPDEEVTVLIRKHDGEVSIGWLDGGRWIDVWTAAVVTVVEWSDMPE